MPIRAFLLNVSASLLDLVKARPGLTRKVIVDKLGRKTTKWVRLTKEEQSSVELARTPGSGMGWKPLRERMAIYDRDNFHCLW